jgi:hypothetical protein
MEENFLTFFLFFIFKVLENLEVAILKEKKPRSNLNIGHSQSTDEIPS